MTSDSNSLAKTNGVMIEEIVQTILPEMQFVGKELDAVYHDRPLEIKSCQKTCFRSDKSFLIPGPDVFGFEVIRTGP